MSRWRDDHNGPSFSAGAFLIHDLDCKRGDFFVTFVPRLAQASAAPPSAAMKTRKVAGFGRETRSV